MKQIFPSIQRFLKARPAYDWLFFGLLVAIYVGLSLWDITKGAIWFDEAFSAYIIQFSYFDIARYTATDVHPPLFYWLLKTWASLFGTTELALRSLSVVFGAVTVLFSYLWTRRVFGRRVALFAVGVLVLSPLFIRYSQEARMYTLSTAIVMAATYVLTRAREQRKRAPWIWYGVLVTLGMWTHYFTALAWIAHWVWHFIEVRRTGAKGKKFFAQFFSKEWVLAYGLAVLLFVPWMVAMVTQLLTIQSTGFWIGAVGVDTVGSYFGTLVFFLQSHQITGWFAAALLLMGTLFTIYAVRAYRRLTPSKRGMFLLIFCLAAVPPIVLFLVSLPPLTSSFVERYLLPAAVASALLSGIVFATALRGAAGWRQVAVMFAVVALLIPGLANMYYYNNYNKNSRTEINTRELVRQAMERADPGEPIVTTTPWTFYEAIFYETPENPIYFVDETTEYVFGSLDMLKENDQHKIKDIEAFTEQHPKIWLIGYTDGKIEPLRNYWLPIDETSVTSKIDGKTVYKGVEFLIEN